MLQPKQVRCRLLLPLILLLLAFLGLGGDALADEPVYGGTLNVGLEGDINTLDPAYSGAYTDFNLNYAIYEALLAWDENLGVGPNLARDWKVIDDKTIVLYLQKGVVFHDGTPFNADAVKWNLERNIQEKGNRVASLLEPIASVEVIDNYTVRLRLKHPYVPLLHYLADKAGTMISPTAFQKWGKDYPKHAVGTGPFKLVEFRRGERYVVERFEDYWREGQPYLDRVVFHAMPNAAARIAQLRAGTIDTTCGIPPTEIPRLKADSRFTVYSDVPARTILIQVNCSRPGLDNVDLRRALNMAVGREALHRSVFLGVGAPAYGPLTPGHRLFYDPNFKPYARPDLEQAKALVKKAALPAGFTLELATYNYALFETLAQALQAQWAEIGVNVAVKVYERAELTDRTYAGNYDMAILYYSNPEVDRVTHRLFHSKGSWNTMINYDAPELDRLLERGQQTYDTEARRSIYLEAQRMIVEDAAAIYVYFWPYDLVVSNRVRGLTYIPDGNLRLRAVWLAGK